MTATGPARGFCPQCEIRAAQAQLTPEVIKARALAQEELPGITAGRDLYEARLAVCKSCPSLQGGLVCAECGSYVAYRARLKAAVCPAPGRNKWIFGEET